MGQTNEGMGNKCDRIEGRRLNVRKGQREDENHFPKLTTQCSKSQGEIMG
jgi:hypothetical protein